MNTGGGNECGRGRGKVRRPGQAGGGGGIGGGKGRNRGGGRGRGRRGIRNANSIEPAVFSGSDQTRDASDDLGAKSSEVEIQTLRAKARAMKDALRAADELIYSLYHGRSSVHAVVAAEEDNVNLPERAWRNKMVASIDKEECILCGVCAEACPDEAIVVNDVASIETQKCIGCGSCVDQCPTEAISLVELNEEFAQERLSK